MASKGRIWLTADRGLDHLGSFHLHIQIGSRGFRGLEGGGWNSILPLAPGDNLRRGEMWLKITRGVNVSRPTCQDGGPKQLTC